MDLLFWDGVVRGGASAFFGLLALLFARDWRRSLTARLGTLLTLGAISYMIISVLPPERNAALWRLPVHVLSLAAPSLFWLFARSWFDDDFVLRRRHVAVVVALTLLGYSAGVVFALTGERITALAVGWRGLGIALVMLGIVAALRGRNADLVESRRHVRLALAIAIAVAIGWIVMTEVVVKGWPPPLAWRLANGAMLFALALVVVLSTTGWRDAALLAAPARPVVLAGILEPDDAPLLARLDTDMRHERLYRQDGLTITAVAARLGVPEYRLRRAINQGLGARNFNAYLNGFRLLEAEEALADPAQRDVPILTIAMDAGFGSLAPFNRAFRDRHGCTPSEYRARA